MGRDPLPRLRAANPLPDLPAPGSPERVHRLIEDGHEPLATPSRVPARNVGLLISLTAITLLALVTIALAATGVILTGAPVRPEEVLNPGVGVGVPAPGVSRLLPIRVADPAGGPPWGMRIVSTTRGEECVQIGRVQNGQLGELGIDGAFHDDGRFHPIPTDALPRDEFHHRVFDSLLGTATTSCHLDGQALAGEHIGVSPSAAAETHGSNGAIDGLRDLLYGVLGSQAVSVSYRHGTTERTAKVLASIGAYLIVTPTAAHQQVGYGGESLGTYGDLAPSPPLTSITYSIKGKLCERGLTEPPWVHRHPTNTCPWPHFRKSPAPLRDLHEPPHVRLLIARHLITGAEVSFTAPFAVRSAREHYVISIPSVPCRVQPGVFSGGLEATAQNIPRGALIALKIPDPFAKVCAGHPATIEVQYAPFPGGQVRIGTATIKLPAGTRPQPPPVRASRHRTHRQINAK
jgi:hypothetical protein